MTEPSGAMQHHADVVWKFAHCVGICVLLLIGGLFGLAGFFSWVEFFVLSVAAVIAFSNYSRYLTSLEQLLAAGDESRELRRIQVHFFLCMLSFVLGLVSIVRHWPVAFITFAVCLVYFIYLRSNLAALRFLTHCSAVKAEDDQAGGKSDDAAEQTRQDRFVNAVATSFYVFRDENLLSFYGYAGLTALSSIVAYLSVSHMLLSTADVQNLGGFAAGAAVGHLSVSALAFLRMMRSNEAHLKSAAAAASDVVDMVLYVFGPAKTVEVRCGRCERAVEIAVNVTSGRVAGLARSTWLVCWLGIAAIFSAVAIAAGHASTAPAVAKDPPMMQVSNGQN